jgi:acyl carrier protein
VGSESKVIQLLTEKYGVDAERISPDATMADLGLDSLAMAELIFDIEDEFDIEISMEEAQWWTFGEAVALVDRHIEAKGA